MTIEIDNKKMWESLIKTMENGDHLLGSKEVISALKDQGLEYKNGEIVSIEPVSQRMVSAEAKEALLPDREKVSMKVLPYVERLKKQGERKCGGNVNDEALQKQLQIWFDKGKCSGIDEVHNNPEKYGLQVEQKPVEWSEEDEKYMQSIVEHLEFEKKRDGTQFGAKIMDEHIDWLKSLKDRCIPQPKQEWSEEDEAKLKSILFHIEDVENKDVIYWLKSLRPQKQWKPSEEQMNALKHASNDCSIAFADMKILATLYEQLKALHRYEQDT